MHFDSSAKHELFILFSLKKTRGHGTKEYVE